ncbi:MAG: MrcB family domain-containing protein [Acidimicrobiia bacterium]
MKRSAGQGNWAETPWVSGFDLNVTDTATRGYYVVFLVRGDGAGVALSLNHGTTEVFNQAGRRLCRCAGSSHSSERLRRPDLRNRLRRANRPELKLG